MRDTGTFPTRVMVIMLMLMLMRMITTIAMIMIMIMAMVVIMRMSMSMSMITITLVGKVPVSRIFLAMVQRWNQRKENRSWHSSVSEARISAFNVGDEAPWTAFYETNEKASYIHINIMYIYIY